MRMEEVRRMVSEVTGSDWTMQKLWYSLKYNLGMVMAVEGDADVRMFLKVNYEYRYFYVGKSDGPKRHAEKSSDVSAGPVSIVGAGGTPAKISDLPLHVQDVRNYLLRSLSADDETLLCDVRQRCKLSYLTEGGVAHLTTVDMKGLVNIVSRNGPETKRKTTALVDS
ncbi:hypothetical protein Cgig2_011463 [Carnegiea gigantea]|uniref:Uncharacterized protein n=1 Tax=Carnegiea gigantea TaxID=171969 RepID=A0A9Q1QNJ9_9CARY|nr:hypothetical protein Cgig2_011463 [Carnegiea gigantea]